MGDFQGPFIVSPPPAPSSSDKSSTTMLYYGLVVVGVAAIALALYNFIIIRRSRRRHMQSQAEGANGVVEVVIESRIENCQINFNLVSSFKYKKGVVDYDDDDECSVCLSGFEEGEEVRKLPQCKHWFHAPCIDMWLYSHLDCPICRTPVVRFSQHNSRPASLESGGDVSDLALRWNCDHSVLHTTFSTRNRHRAKAPNFGYLVSDVTSQKRFRTPHFDFFS
ncbi:unnamed protein product [Sphenostylis stenocarpa]|uniref:RING-type domain-containing protein n=1 Tax=Sphenostylis stenocarpa TaxID=92480 RepID=A0AA86S738_9FABA|nr:unnamed protein product [Sphenostylis stenocarpa]